MQIHAETLAGGLWRPRAEDRLTRREAEETLRTAIGWGRYAELFSCDDRTRTFALHGDA